MSPSAAVWRKPTAAFYLKKKLNSNPIALIIVLVCAKILAVVRRDSERKEVMGKFVRCSTPAGGIYAVVLEETHRRIVAGDTSARPIFLFSDNPVLSHLFVGSLRLMSECLEDQDVRWKEFPFPFSSGLGFQEGVIEELAQNPEILLQLATLDEVISAFGLTPERVGRIKIKLH